MNSNPRFTLNEHKITKKPNKNKIHEKRYETSITLYQKYELTSELLLATAATTFGRQALRGHSVHDQKRLEQKLAGGVPSTPLYIL